MEEPQNSIKMVENTAEVEKNKCMAPKKVEMPPVKMLTPMLCKVCTVFFGTIRTWTFEIPYPPDVTGCGASFFEYLETNC